MERIPIAWRALTVQLAALSAVWSVVHGQALPLAPWQALAMLSLVALIASIATGLPRWWWPIQAGFGPAVVAGVVADVQPWIYFAAFACLWLIFNRSHTDRVPLFLTNDTTTKALLGLVPNRPGIAFLDLGSGIGSTLAGLAESRPNGIFRGIEAAPLPYLIGALRLLGKPNASVRFGDFWNSDLGLYDVVYCFLSPEPMARLWEKAHREMRPNTFLISNSFEIPTRAPDSVVEVNDRRQTRLLVWRIPEDESHSPTPGDD